MVETVNQLSAHAKMNFRHEDCWQVYTALIEGGIRHLIDGYFKNWQLIEDEIGAIMMKHKGVLTGRIITHIAENDTVVPDITDVKKFWQIKRMSIIQKLDYLVKNELISRPIYELLSKLAKRGNKIHNYYEVLTDDDRELFARGYTLLHPTFTARCFEEQADHWKYQIEANDKAAAELLKLINAQESSKSKVPLFADIDVSRVKGGWELDKERGSKPSP